MFARTTILFVMLSIPSLVLSQTNADKTMLKSFNLHGISTIRLDLPGQVEIKTWDNPTVKIEIAVSLANGNAAMLNELANVGRYNLTEKTTGTEMTISAENLSKIIKVRGQELKEHIAFLVYAPKDVPVTVTQALAASTNK